MLKKRISESKGLGSLKSDSARLLYTWLIPWLDIKGRHSADPEIIKGHIFPKIKSMTIKKIITLLTDLDNNNLIISYQADGEGYLQYTQFTKHQILNPKKEATTKIPDPPESSGELRRTPENSSTSKVKQSKVKQSKDKPSYAPNDKINCSEQAKINYNFDLRKWENITDEDIKLWKETYPACDIEEEILRMGDWLISNPTKRKTNYRRFITNWFSRSQDKGGTRSKTKKKALMGPVKW